MRHCAGRSTLPLPGRRGRLWARRARVNLADGNRIHVQDRNRIPADMGTLAAIPPRSYAVLVLSGGDRASWLCYCRAPQTGDAARVAPIGKLSGVLAALFGVVFFGERLNRLGTLLIASWSPPSVRVGAPRRRCRRGARIP
jgi:hypothetical protein